MPDRNCAGSAYDFGLNRSPDGIIEYKYGGFGGALDGKLLVARFSSGDDIIVLDPGLDGNIIGPNDTIASFDGFDDPLDMVGNPAQWLSSTFRSLTAPGQGTITLLRPQEPNSALDKSHLVFDEVRGGAASAAKTIIVTNTGTATLTMSSITITGADAALFSVSPNDYDAGDDRPRRVAEHQHRVQSDRRQSLGPRWRI